MSTDLLLINPKFPHNVGAAIRALSCYGGGGVYFTGRRVDTDTMKRIPREERMKGYFDTPWKALKDHPRPVDDIIGTNDIIPVAIELVPGAESLMHFEHPDNALYIFGPEDGSIPSGIKPVCHRFVYIPSQHCLNLSSAAYIVLYDRMVKRVAAGLEDPPSTVDSEERGYWFSPSLERA
jgi:tRNA(Leu) C34 or U34 (ribose-2'-O)-methylase TrmL